MSAATKVALVYDSNGDWTAMYLNGVLVDQGHSLSGDRVARRLIGLEVESLDEYEADISELGGWALEKLEDYDDLRTW